MDSQSQWGGSIIINEIDEETSEIALLKNLLHEAYFQRISLQNSLEDLQLKNENLEKRFKIEQNYLFKILNSKSWLLTWPLRFTMFCLKKIKSFISKLIHR